MALSINCPPCKQANQFDDDRKGQEVRCTHSKDRRFNEEVATAQKAIQARGK